MANLIFLRVSSARYYKAADHLRRLAAEALLGGEYRLAAMRREEERNLRAEGDRVLRAELAGSLRLAGR